MRRICFVVAVPGTARSFLCDHISELAKEYEVYLVGNIKDKTEVDDLRLTGYKSIRIERGMSLWRDLKAVWSAFRYFREMKFDAVHSVTPKAGLLTAIAGRLAGIKHRTHIFTGQVWATCSGFKRWLLKTLDQIIVLLDNHIIVDGKSQRAFLVKEKVLKENQAEVFGAGSISGVNVRRFSPDPEARMTIRRELGLGDDVVTYIFLGRLNHDKGIGEIYEAFNRLAGEVCNVFLLLVGSDEEHYVDKILLYDNIKSGKNFCFYGRTSTPEKVLNAGDIFLLPSYREGFGTSVLEAACIGLPSICSDAYGLQDAYVENETGLRCRVGDVNSLYECMRRLYDDPIIAKKMGEKARQRILKDFDGSRLTEYWVDFYRKIL